MRKGLITCVALVVFAPIPVLAGVTGEDCVNFTKVVGANQSKSNYMRATRYMTYSNYCSSHKFIRSQNSSQKAELLYETLYGKYDSSMGDAQTLMDNFCATYDSKADEELASSAEQRQVSDRAVQGFETCIKAASNGVTIKPVITNSTISITFSSGGNSLKLISLFASSNLKCSANDGRGPVKNLDASMVVTLPPGEVAKIDCSRTTYSTPDGKTGYLPSDFSVGVGYGGSGDTVPISLPGDSLVTPQGANDLNAKIEALSGILRNHAMVVAFAGNQCPAPWLPYPPAMGRFIRGIDPTGVIDPDGVRSSGQYQADGIAYHSHTLGVNGADSSSMVPGGATQRLPHFISDTYGNGAPKTTNNNINGITETRPKNIALMYCILN